MHSIYFMIIRHFKQNLRQVMTQRLILPFRYQCRNFRSLFNSSYTYFNDYIPIKNDELRQQMDRATMYKQNGVVKEEIQFRILGSKLIGHMIQTVKNLKKDEIQKSHELSQDQFRILSSEFYKKIQELISQEYLYTNSSQSIFFKQELTEHLRRYFILSLRFFDKLSQEGGVLSYHRSKGQQDEYAIYLLRHFTSDLQEKQHGLVDRIVEIMQQKINFIPPTDLRVHIINRLRQVQKEGYYCEELINHFICLFDTNKEFILEESQTRFGQGAVNHLNTFNPIGELSPIIINLIFVKTTIKNVFIIGSQMLGKSYMAHLGYLLDRRRKETMMYISQIDHLFELKHMGMAMFEACWNHCGLQDIEIMSQFAVKSQQQLQNFKSHLNHRETRKNYQKRFLQIYFRQNITMLIDQCNYFTESEKLLQKWKQQNVNEQQIKPLQQQVKLHLQFLKDVLRHNSNKMIFLSQQNSQNARFKSIVESVRFQTKHETIYKRLEPFKSKETFNQILNFEIERKINVEDGELIKLFLGNRFASRLIQKLQRFNYLTVKQTAQLGIKYGCQIKKCLAQRIQVDGSFNQGKKIKIDKYEELQDQIIKQVINKRVYHLTMQTDNWISNSMAPNLLKENNSSTIKKQNAQNQTFKEKMQWLHKLIFYNQSLDLQDLQNYQMYPLHLMNPQSGKAYSFLIKNCYFFKRLFKRMFKNKHNLLEQEGRRILELLKYTEKDLKVERITDEIRKIIERFFYCLCPANHELANLFLPKKYHNPYRIIQIGQQMFCDKKLITNRQNNFKKIKNFSTLKMNSIIEIGYFHGDYNKTQFVDFFFLFIDPQKNTLNVVLTRVGINITLVDFKKIKKYYNQTYIGTKNQPKIVIQNMQVKWHLWILTNQQNDFQQLKNIQKQGVYQRLQKQNKDEISRLQKIRQQQIGDQSEIQSKINELQSEKDQYSSFLRRREQEAKKKKCRHTLGQNIQSFRVSNVRNLNSAFEEYFRRREIQQMKKKQTIKQKNKK